VVCVQALNVKTTKAVLLRFVLLMFLGNGKLSEDYFTVDFEDV
jgi:hypothetical protein